MYLTQVIYLNYSHVPKSSNHIHQCNMYFTLSYPTQIENRKCVFICLWGWICLIILDKFDSLYPIRSQIVRIIHSTLQHVPSIDKNVPWCIAISWFDLVLYILISTTVTTIHDPGKSCFETHLLHSYLGSWIMSSKPCKNRKFVMHKTHQPSCTQNSSGITSAALLSEHLHIRYPLSSSKFLHLCKHNGIGLTSFEIDCFLGQGIDFLSRDSYLLNSRLHGWLCNSPLLFLS